MERFGFIGMGNMAKALADGFIASGALQKEQVFAFAPNQEKLRKNAETIGFTPVGSLKELAAQCDTLIMACKPYQIEGVLSEIGDQIKGKVLLSIAAGWDYARYSACPYMDQVRIQFIMPNTPAMVREGILLFEEIHSLTEGTVWCFGTCAGFADTSDGNRWRRLRLCAGFRGSFHRSLCGCGSKIRHPKGCRI